MTDNSVQPTTPPKLTPFEKKRDRLWTAIGSVREQLDDLMSRRAFAVADAEKAKSAAELAVSHAKEDIAAVADHTLNLLARRDQLRAELEQVAALIVNAAQLGEEKATAAVTAGRQLTASESALIEVGKPFDRHIEALRDDSEKLKYRFDQHIARGPGSTTLFVGVRR